MMFFPDGMVCAPLPANAPLVDCEPPTFDQQQGPPMMVMMDQSGGPPPMFMMAQEGGPAPSMVSMGPALAPEPAADVGVVVVPPREAGKPPAQASSAAVPCPCRNLLPAVLPVFYTVAPSMMMMDGNGQQHPMQHMQEMPQMQWQWEQQGQWSDMQQWEEESWSQYESGQELRHRRGHKGGKPRRRNECYSPVLSAIMDGEEVPFHHLQGHVVELAMNEAGRAHLINQPSDVQSYLVAELTHCATDIARNPHGKQTLLHYLEHAHEDGVRQLIAALAKDCFALSMHQHGCRVLQQAIQVCPTVADQEVLFKAIQGSLVQIAENMHGNHVVQKCVESMAPRIVRSIMEELTPVATRLATNPFASRVLQRILEHGSSHALLDTLVADPGPLISQKFANYVMQHVLEHGQPQHKARIVNALVDAIDVFALDKCASNVVERALSWLPEHREVLLAAITPPDLLAKIGADRYGAFVVQAALEVATGKAREQLQDNVDANQSLCVEGEC